MPYDKHFFDLRLVITTVLILFLTSCATHDKTTRINMPANGAAASVSMQTQAAMQDGVEVKQVNRQFVMSNELVQSINVKVGDKINFKNADDTAHNIYSTSELKTFDLGSFMPGEVRTVSFEKKGNALVECAIHPQMQLDVTVN